MDEGASVGDPGVPTKLALSMKHSIVKVSLIFISIYHLDESISFQAFIIDALVLFGDHLAVPFRI